MLPLLNHNLLKHVVNSPTGEISEVKVKMENIRNVIDFKTKSLILERKMPRVLGNNQHKGKTLIAMDGGYSAVKGVSPDRLFIFPSYAKRVEKELERVGGKVDPLDIQYRNNETGEIWLVGRIAMAFLDNIDLEGTTDASMYNRYRYTSDVYKVIMSTGLAIGCIGAGDNDIYLQTGLPATYKDQDEGKIISALSGHYNISIKFGAGEWIDFNFDLPEDHIFVMEQPQGTLCACAYQMDGTLSAQGRDILSSGTIIHDVGFGTEDNFAIKAGFKNNHQTHTDTAMKSVFEETLKEIKRKNSYVETKVFELQNFLETGILTSFNVDTFEEDEIDFKDILFRKNDELCDKSIKQLMLDYENLKGFKYLVVTGGTGESRFDMIADKLKGLKSLKVIPGNLNFPDIPSSFSNVIGYYLFRHAKFVKETKE